GIGEYYNARTPQRLHFADGSPFDNVVSVASGNSHAAAVRGDGSVWMWGSLETIIDGIAEEPHIFPEERQGDPQSLYPVQIRHADSRPFTGAVQVGALDWHTLVLTEDSQVWGWGRPDLLALPGPHRERRRYAPAPELSTVGAVGEPHRITGIATTQTHSVALLDDGTALSWGGNRYGQLGHGTTIVSAKPDSARIQSPRGEALDGIAEIALTHWGTLVLLTDGTVHYIGGDAQGNGEYVEEVENHTPATERWSQVTHPDGTPFDGVVSIGAGFYSAHLITEDGRIHSFGLNMTGPLGDGTEEDRYYPVPLVYVPDPDSEHFLEGHDYEEDEWWD
ncbi:Regulator of chromosome condensation (RCC1) repeat-containing protein, partial [Alkalispirochaeta americana]